MARNISFNGISFQDANVRTKDIKHEDVSNREVNFQRLGSSGAKLVDDSLNVKVVRIAGNIVDTTSALLDARIDSLKKTLISTINKDLDIDYSTGTRRYIATCTMFKADREFFDITTCPFEAEFTIGEGFGKNTDTTTLAYTGITTAERDSGFFYGSIAPLPKIKLTIVSETALTAFQFQNLTTGDTVTVTHDLNAGDIVIIDCELLKVTVNGVEVDYVGVFPEFENGWNDFYLWFTATAYNVNLKLIYYQLWV